MQQLLTNIFPHLPPPFSKIPQITLWGISESSISTTTTPIPVKPTISSPAGGSSPTSIKVTTPYNNSLPLHTIPPIDIYPKSPKVGKLHPRSPPPPHLPWSN